MKVEAALFFCVRSTKKRKKNDRGSAYFYYLCNVNKYIAKVCR